MLLVKIEKPGGLWDYLEFDTETEVVNYLFKNPGVKLRLAFKSDYDLASKIKNEKIKLDEKRSSSRV